MPYCHVQHSNEPPHQIYFEKYGSPEAKHKLIFIMGLGGTMTHWEKQVEYFQKQPEEFQVLIFENRGIGFSEPVSGRWTTSKFAKDALFLLDYVDWKDKVNVVGVSMGGVRLLI